MNGKRKKKKKTQVHELINILTTLRKETTRRNRINPEWK